MTTEKAEFFRFLILWISQFAYVSVSLCICGSVWNPSQVFKNSLLWDSQWPLSQKMKKNAVISICWEREAVLLIMIQSWSCGSQRLDKDNNYWIGQMHIWSSIQGYNPKSSNCCIKTLIKSSNKLVEVTIVPEFG